MPPRLPFADLDGETIRYIESRSRQPDPQGTLARPDTGGRSYPGRDAPVISLRQWLPGRIAALLMRRA